MKIPKTPFSTRLSGSAKETELRIRSIFQWKKKRPPAAFVLLVAVAVLLCFGLFGFRGAGQPEHQTLYDIHREFIITWKSRVAEITYYNTDHGFYEYTDGDDGIADVEDFFKSVQLGSSVNPRKYIKEDDKGYHIFEVCAGGGGRLKIKFFVDDRVVLVGSLEENEWPSNFADDAKAYRLPDGVDRDGILALLYSAAEDNEESPPTPEPQPEPTPGRNEDNEFVLNYVDAMFAQGDTQLWAFLFPGTGPIAAPVDELYAQVRDVFARYEWTPETGSAPEPSMTHDDFTMYLVDGWSRRIEHITNSNRVSLSFTTEQGTAYAAYSYNGEPGSLSDALLALWGGPEFRYALVVLPPQGQDDRTLMEIYERQFREMYLNSGAIDDYKLQELELISVGEVIGGSQSPFFLMSYSVKPADLSAPCWRNYAVGEDGWVNISVEVNLSLTGYANNETVWRCGFWQYPNDKE